MRITLFALFVASLTFLQACKKEKPDVVPEKSKQLDFTWQESTQQNQYFVFKANMPDAAEYLWNFGDGATSKEKEPGHIYRNTGRYTVTLTIDNDPAFIVSKELFVDRKATFTFEGNLVAGKSISFTPVPPLYLSAIKYHWDFGDGTTSTDVYPKHVYKNEGIYKVTLMLNDSMQAIGQANGVIRIISSSVTSKISGSRNYKVTVQAGNHEGVNDTTYKLPDMSIRIDRVDEVTVSVISPTYFGGVYRYNQAYSDDDKITFVSLPGKSIVYNKTTGKITINELSQEIVKGKKFGQITAETP